MQHQPRRISPNELEEVLAHAQKDRWDQLALLGPNVHADWLLRQGWPVERIFLLKEQLGAEGARAMAAPTHFTSIDLSGNDIGAEGARALAALTNLTLLNLSGNGIGAEGRAPWRR